MSQRTDEAPLAFMLLFYCALALMLGAAFRGGWVFMKSLIG